MYRSWFRGPGLEPDDGADGVEFEPHDLVGLFVAPRWLRDLGFSAWLAVGVTLFLVGAVWLLTLTQTIVTPVITAGVIAAVASPLVKKLERRGVGRGAAAALLIVLVIALTTVIVVGVLAGITSQLDGLRTQLTAAKGTITGWLGDAGVSQSTAQASVSDASSTISKVVPALLGGIGDALKTLSSLAFFLSLTFLSTFFLMKDGPLIRAWSERHMHVMPSTAHAITTRVLQSLRAYFVGVTVVAVFNAVVVLVGALLLGVPLAGSIAAVTFFGAYVPYLGAWGAGIFSVLVALGGAGTDAAIGMIVVQLLANGVLQQLVQPIAYGAALGIHPLAVLVVTIGAGSLFGAVGLILAAPLTAAATRIASDLARNRDDLQPEVAT
jgi:predicted PurR-regulated permease PerM